MANAYVYDYKGPEELGTAQFKADLLKKSLNRWTLHLRPCQILYQCFAY
jgi:hypothetical protein